MNTRPTDNIILINWYILLMSIAISFMEYSRTSYIGMSCGGGGGGGGMVE